MNVGFGYKAQPGDIIIKQPQKKPPQATLPPGSRITIKETLLSIQTPEKTAQAPQPKEPKAEEKRLDVEG